jgi:hypothetical protein
MALPLAKVAMKPSALTQAHNRRRTAIFPTVSNKTRVGSGMVF